MWPMSLPEPAEPLSDLLQRSHLGILAKDSAGNLQVWSDGAERLFGWKKEEVIGRPASAVFQLQSMLEGELQVCLPRKDGTIIDVDIWPGLDGFAVIREIRRDRELAAVPVMALTASAMQGDRERALSAGFTAYIAKPIPLSMLRSEVQRLLQAGVLHVNDH